MTTATVHPTQGVADHARDPVTATPGLSAIKLSVGGKEVVYVGTMDPKTMTMQDLVTPLVPTSPNAQLLDAATYASKSFYDPVHKQQVWTSWIHDTGKYCAVNASVCSSHTLPRTLLYDAELKAHVTPPVPQTVLLRKERLHSLDSPTRLGANSYLPLPAAVEAAGMQLEVLATFSLPFPPGFSAGVSMRRSKDTLQNTQSWVSMKQAADGDGAGQVATVRTEVDNSNGLPPATKAKNGKYTLKKQLDFAMKRSDSNITLRIFVDHSVIESYAQGGRGVVTVRTYPTDDALGVGVGTMSPNRTTSGSDAGVTLLGLEVWSVDTIWVDKV